MTLLIILLVCGGMKIGKIVPAVSNSSGGRRESIPDRDRGRDAALWNDAATHLTSAAVGRRSVAMK